MTVTVTGTGVALRLLAALVAGGLIGFDRPTRGRIAGLRTTMLMCLAAIGAMIEANLMLEVTGRTTQSFTMMDALRFPLGILSGIGFIGAGHIVGRAVQRQSAGLAPELVEQLADETASWRWIGSRSAPGIFLNKAGTRRRFRHFQWVIHRSEMTDAHKERRE